MKIITQNVNNDYLNKNKNSKKNTFRAHPDFKKLTQDSNIVVSSFFRRGTKYGSPSIHFIDIIILLAYLSVTIFLLCLFKTVFFLLK